MKKTILFFALIFGMISLSPAQISKESYRKYMKKPIEPVQSKVVYPKKDIKLPNASEKSTSDNIVRIPIGKSADVFSILHSEQRPLSYIAKQGYNDLRRLQYTFTADPETYTDANSKGSIVSSYSEVSFDEGFNYFETSLLINNDNFMTNPSAIFIKSPESEELEEFYTVVSGDDSLSGTWSNTALVSSRINNNNYQEDILSWESENDKARSSMTLKEGEVYIFGQDFENIGDYGKHQTLKHYRGQTENLENGFTWEINSVSPDWLIDPEDGFAYALYTTWSAWSEDGSIGYMWMIGVTNESYDYGVYQPQVYYTTDKGESWNEIELNLENNYVLADYLQPWLDENGEPGTVRPSFLSAEQNYPGAVDYEGRLHLFSNVYGSTKGDVLNPADSNWIDPEAKGGHVFSFIINENGISDIIPVSEFKTKPSSNMYGNVGHNHRLQVAKTTDEYFIVACWIDDVISNSDSLIRPDVFAWSWCPGDLTEGPDNLTATSLYEGFYFFPSVAEHVDLSDFYYGVDLNMTCSVTLAEYVNSEPNNPISHYYIEGLNVPVSEWCLGSVNENLQNISAITVSQNTPNPFSGETKIEILSSFQEPKAVSLEITDLLGHTVYKSFEGKIEEVKELTIHAEDLKQGVYFYTICVGEECQTKKMIVE